MPELNICTTSPKLIEALKAIKPLTGFTHSFNQSGGIKIEITSSLPETLTDGTKYILCTRSPHAINADKLSRLYDIWPMPLTRELIAFLFRNVQLRIKSEHDDASEREYQKRILEMARQDYLTGLATRWYLQDYIQSRDQEQSLTCIYLDLDNFKAVNDTYGHQAGDRALAATAEMMQTEFPDGFAARMGGDEFMLVLFGNNDVYTVSQRVRLFMARLLKYYATTRTMKALSVSAGISSGKCRDIDRIIHEADEALYAAKKSGKAMCKIYGA